MKLKIVIVAFLLTITSTFAQTDRYQVLCPPNCPHVSSKTDMPIITPQQLAATDDRPLTDEERKHAESLILSFIFTCIGIYMLPGLVAIYRGHPSKAGIFVLNLFLGWTFLFWILALVWALSATKQHVVITQNKT